MNFQASEGDQDLDSLSMGNLPTMLYAYSKPLKLLVSARSLTNHIFSNGFAALG